MTVLELPTPDPRGFDDTSRPFVEAVASRYAIKRLIGRGGMGIVYLARDRRLERLVAIKTLPPQLAADESVKQRFLREIRTAGAMSHPNVVPIHGADEIDGHVFFVMGFVDGESLATMIRGLGRLEPMDTARILRDVSAALSHAHARGIIHRDIKAENVLVERTTGKAMVTDFGIARLAEAGPLTATGQLLGTVYYVSPEQVSGEKIDARSDIYALGVAGFFALTGTFPFEAELASAVLVAHVNKPAPPVRSLAPHVPPALAAIIDRCLMKNRESRFESAEKLIDVLDAFIASGGRAAKRQLISDTEAHAVWERAASLQASSGTSSVPIPALRDETADARRTSGHAVTDVRDAGREAGINTRYLDRALIERGLAPFHASGRTLPQKPAWWAGVPVQVVEQADADGELNPSRFDSILNLVRDGTGAAGSIVASRRELGWRADSFGSILNVSVVPAEGRTTVRIEQHTRGLAAVVTLASTFAGTVVAPFVAVMAERVMMSRATPHWVRSLGIDLYFHRHDIQSIAVGVGLATIIAAIPIGRALNRLFARHTQRRVHLLTEAVVAKAQLAINEDRAK
jgi:serine/threonine-protein kinase